MKNTNTKTCSIENCEKPSRTRGWCDKHYRRWLAHGDPLKARKYYTSTDASFAANTSWRGDCLIWTGFQASNGYGRMVVKGRQVQAHRFAWEKVNGKIPDGLQIDHANHCSILCCNVEHLRLATQKQNLWNLSGARSDNKSSGVRNVYKRPNGNFSVSVYRDGESHNYGTYRSLKEAAKVAEQARRELFGEFAGKG